jgi:hypothetical protein
MMANDTQAQDTQAQVTAKEELPLAKAAEMLLAECRLVLPGIQALFGFQLIAVFNPAFSEKLDKPQQLIHLVAIALIAIAIALIMTPAAYHRQSQPREVTMQFFRVVTRLMLWSMLPLCLGISMDFYLVASIIIDGVIACIMAVLLLTIFLVLWFALPRMKALQHAVSDLHSMHVH